MTDDVLNMMNGIPTADPVEENNNQPVEQVNTIDGDSDTYSLTLTKDNFLKFTASLGILQNICNDCDIRDGVIRCRTNDRKNIILMDLTSLVGNRNICFSGLKNKLTLLSTFSFVSDSTAENSVLIESNQSNFEFSDSLSKLIIRRPILAYMENVYMDDDDFSNINNAVTREDNLLFNITVSSVEKKRLAKLCESFTTNTVTFEFNGDTGCYTTQTSSKDNMSRTNQIFNMHKNIDNKKTLVNNLSFILDTPSNLELSCYIVGTNYCMFKCDLNYYGIPIKLYTKSKIVDLNSD